MKHLLIALFMTVSTSSAFAACPSVDNTIAASYQGTATATDVAQVLLCYLKAYNATTPLCNTTAGAYKDILVETEARFELGEVTRTDVDIARAQAEKYAKACVK